MNITMFFKQTKQKTFIFFGLLVFLLALSFLLIVVLNEKDIAGIYLVPLLRWPVMLFDFVTFSQFAPECGGSFLCFPTIPELLFIAVFDLALIYLISCGISAVIRRKS